MSPSLRKDCALCILHAMQRNHQKKNPTQTTRQTDKAARKTPEKHPRERRREKKKKTRRGGNLGEGENEDERIEVVVLGRDEETQGEPQTPRRGFGFPQRLREKEETRKHGVDETNHAKEKKRRGTHTRAKYGSGLEGLKNQTNDQPQRQKRDTINQITETKTVTEKRTEEPIHVSRDLSTAGWRGPWAALPSPEESPRGTLIPRDQMVPPSRVRPRGAEVST